jgi:hypothetical protein
LSTAFDLTQPQPTVGVYLDAAAGWLTDFGPAAVTTGVKYQHVENFEGRAKEPAANSLQIQLSGRF